MKRFISIALIAIAAAAVAAAQTAPAAGNTDVKFFGVEAGAALGYDLGQEEVVGSTSFGLSLAVADNMTAGLQLAAGYSLFKLSYFLNPSLGFTAYLGQDATPDVAAGMGVFYLIGKNQAGSGLASAYRIKADFFFPADDIGSGLLALTAAMSLGL